jgi:alginate O-acetyltransferase complex protein AlgI
MVFSSVIFLVFFFPVVLTIYRLADVRFKNSWLLLTSIFFYAWGAPKFIFILLPLTALDFHIVRKMYALPDGKEKRKWLAFSILINMGILAYFKYANFFIGNVNHALSLFGIHQLTWVAVVLPIGISFFCFETLTYSIDAYRGVIKPLDKLKDYYLYIFFFPKLIAGPIVRFNLISHQMDAANRSNHASDLLLGFSRFIIGLSKKMLIANVMAEMADSYLNGDLHALTSTTAWIGMLAYTFQIYFDFSGYSDMALGMARMMGFRLPENFDHPYTSQSISEFWRRWHMTLGAWMKEYLYIPLGGNRVNSKLRLYFNLWLVFLISGLWHGASWNFVIWGAFHGVFLIMDRLFLVKLLDKCGKFFSIVFTFIIVLVGWVFFRLNGFHDALLVIRKLFSFHFSDAGLPYNPEFVIMMVVALLLSFSAAFPVGEKLLQKCYPEQVTDRKLVVFTVVAVAFFAVCLARVTSAGFNPFIYYRF